MFLSLALAVFKKKKLKVFSLFLVAFFDDHTVHTVPGIISRQRWLHSRFNFLCGGTFNSYGHY